MSLDLDLLENVQFHGYKVTAACPVCQEDGRDSQRVHLVCFGSEGEGPFACVRGCDPKLIWKLAGAKSGAAAGARCLPRARPRPPPRLYDPYPVPPEDRLFIQLIQLRRWPMTAVEGLKMLSARGLLHFEQVYDADRLNLAWVISDGARLNAQARKLNGEGWKGIRNAKAKTVPGIPDARWPIGAANIGDRPLVVLCEGQPDFCSVLPLALEEGVDPELIAPVCITGAHHSIPSDAGGYFAGKTVLIPYHSDASRVGESAATRWTYQLYAYGVSDVITVNCGCLGVKSARTKDLADYLSLRTRSAPLFQPVINRLITRGLERGIGESPPVAAIRGVLGDEIAVG